MRLKRINKKGNASDVITKRFSFLSRKINFEITTFRIYKMSEKFTFFNATTLIMFQQMALQRPGVVAVLALALSQPGASTH